MLFYSVLYLMVNRSSRVIFVSSQVLLKGYWDMLYYFLLFNVLCRTSKKNVLVRAIGGFKAGGEEVQVSYLQSQGILYCSF